MVSLNKDHMVHNTSRSSPFILFYFIFHRPQGEERERGERTSHGWQAGTLWLGEETGEATTPSDRTVHGESPLLICFLRVLLVLCSHCDVT
jgi:hypothetical protein